MANKLENSSTSTYNKNIMKIRNGEFGNAYDAQGGAVVVTNVKTGEILAMASYPDYDPSKFYNGISQSQYNEYLNSKALRSKATQEIYPPGSIFKMVTAVAGLESGAVTPSETINDNGKFIVSDDPNYNNPACWYYNSYGRGHGRLNIVGALQKSCNYYFFDVSNRIGIEKLDEYADYFGLGRKTGIQINESTGVLASREYAESRGEVWSKAYTASASIGQSYNTFTPVQMAKYIAMIANGGHPINLSIVKNVINSNGSQVAQEEIDEYVNKKLGTEKVNTEDKNISEETMAAVHEGMKSVAEEEGGTAYSVFKDFEIEVGGKTGSAELTNNKDSKDVIAWFAGFAPYDDPEIAIVVMVEKGGHGSYTAEVVKEIMQEYFGMNMEEVKEDMTATTEAESFR